MGSATVLSADTLAGGRGPSRCPFTPTQPRLLPRPRRSTPSPLWGHAGLETGLLWLPGLSSPGSISPLDRASTKIEAKLCSGRCHLWASQLPSSSAPAHAPRLRACWSQRLDALLRAFARLSLRWFKCHFFRPACGHDSLGRLRPSVGLSAWMLCSGFSPGCLSGGSNVTSSAPPMTTIH